ncbi:MAG: galactokinase [Xanthomonadales bacterium]|nr:galactokinase [Xanthomonadales bacterium]
MKYESGPEFVRTEFARMFAGTPRLFQAPGRINIIGEHTDYNGGWVLPAPVDLGTFAAMAPRTDGLLRVHLHHENRTYDIALNALEKGRPGDAIEYVKAVAWALQDEGVELAGCDVLIAGTIPLGGGLSSSASLETVLAWLLLDRAGTERERSSVARICQRAEVEFVGVKCGIMDQYAIALGAQQQAMLLNCTSLEFEPIPLPEAAQFLVVNSGVKRQLRSSEYNTRKAQCAAAVTALSDVFPGLQSLAELSLKQLVEHQHRLENTLFQRARHVVSENHRVHQAARALRNSDTRQLGLLLNDSHASLRDDYAVSCAELDQLVDIAGNCPAVLGARMMGAGFGGCTINLVEPGRMDEAMQVIGSEYGQVLGSIPWMHPVRTVAAVNRVDESQHPASKGMAG